jgi:hypothetical protein
MIMGVVHKNAATPIFRSEVRLMVVLEGGI